MFSNVPAVNRRLTPGRLFQTPCTETTPHPDAQRLSRATFRALITLKHLFFALALLLPLLSYAQSPDTAPPEEPAHSRTSSSSAAPPAANPAPLTSAISAPSGYVLSAN